MTCVQAVHGLIITKRPDHQLTDSFHSIDILVGPMSNDQCLSLNATGTGLWRYCQAILDFGQERTDQPK